MTTIKKGQQPVEDQVRQKFFASIRHQNQNNICIDCQKKNPKWASIYLGIQLCIDCAGKHRQYGVVYSFIKSTNLDKWNHRQILFMQKGGNSRALEYFRKCGIINNNSRQIDYKSPVVQKYKSILTEEVDTEINGAPLVNKIEKKEQSNISSSMSQQANNIFTDNEKVEQKQIPNAQMVVKEENTENQKPKKKKGKKKMGNQINIADFESMTFDDGVSKQQKQKIVKSYETSAQNQTPAVKQGEEHEHGGQQTHKQPIVQEKPQPKELSEQQVAKKMQQIKTQANVKSISSQQFKDDSLDNVQIKQKFNQFQGATSISSSSFNNQEAETQNQTVEKLKDFVSSTGGMIYGKLSSYWSK